MKFMLVVIGLVISIPEADAAYCHAGVYRSGCVSRYGATVWRHGYRGYANRCYWRNGKRVCRHEHAWPGPPRHPRHHPAWRPRRAYVSPGWQPGYGLGWYGNGGIGLILLIVIILIVLGRF